MQKSQNELKNILLKQKQEAEDFKKDLEKLCYDVFGNFDENKFEEFKEGFERLDIVILSCEKNF